MESIGKECTELKNKYEDCFNKWYSEEFLRGRIESNPCKYLFDDYRACILVALKERKLEHLIKSQKEKESSSSSSSSTSSSNK